LPFDYEIQKVHAVYSDVTATRTLGTNYQNTIGRPIVVILSLVCSRAAIGERAYVIVNVKGSTPADTAVARAGLIDAANVPIEKAYFMCVFLVPNNFYYRVTVQTTGGGAVTKSRWVEVEL